MPVARRPGASIFPPSRRRRRCPARARGWSGFLAGADRAGEVLKLEAQRLLRLHAGDHHVARSVDELVLAEVGSAPRRPCAVIYAGTGSSAAVSSYWTMRLLPTTIIWRTLRGASHESCTLAVVPLAKVSVINAVSGTPSAEYATRRSGDLDDTLSLSQYRRIERSWGAKSQTTPSGWYLPRFIREEVTKWMSPTTVGDQLVHRVDSWAVDERVPRHQGQSCGLRQLGQLEAVAEVRCERLLDEHVLAGEQRLLGQGRVRARRGGDQDGLHGVIAEHLLEVGVRACVRVLAGEGMQRAGVAVARASAGTRASQKGCGRGCGPQYPQPTTTAPIGVGWGSRCRGAPHLPRRRPARHCASC